MRPGRQRLSAPGYRSERFPAVEAHGTAHAHG